jgi:hypothetical protein
MRRDLLALLGGEGAVVMRDVEQRLVHLADVVEQRHALDARARSARLEIVETCPGCEQRGLFA